MGEFGRKQLIEKIYCCIDKINRCIKNTCGCDFANTIFVAFLCDIKYQNNILLYIYVTDNNIYNQIVDFLQYFMFTGTLKK